MNFNEPNSYRDENYDSVWVLAKEVIIPDEQKVELYRNSINDIGNYCASSSRLFIRYLSYI